MRRIWYRVLNRRTQRRLTWPWFYDLLETVPSAARSHLTSPTGDRLLIPLSASGLEANLEIYIQGAKFRDRFDFMSSKKLFQRLSKVRVSNIDG